ncbi:ABC transporter substrate-binding protein [Paenibacillus yanchengensis]|uniref:ABC transporter substrate-binding protein n=1 Tax=Paenibacillus yanchengensis TaxID=2035833 RepID=A0ABW4YJ71_9BACL
MVKLYRVMMFLIVTIMVVGCAAPNVIHKDYTNQQITISTGGLIDEQQFYRNYGNFILDHFPGIEINVSNTDNSNTEDSNKVPIDLVVLPWNQFAQLRNDDYLQDVTSYVMRDRFDLTQFSDSMVTAMKDGDEGLYGLASRANVDGIFYNKDMFAAMQVDDLPNEMTWKELLHIAAQFTGEPFGIESLSLSPEELLLNMASLLFDSAGTAVELPEQQWMEALEQVVMAHQLGAVTAGMGELFIEEKAAMYRGMLVNANRFATEASFNYGFVPEPVDPANRDVSQSLYFDLVLAIPKESTQQELAWEIIKTLMSEDVAEQYNIQARNINSGAHISTLKSKMYDYADLSLVPFWEKQIVLSEARYPASISDSFIGELYTILQEQLQLAIEGQLTTEQCYMAIKEKVTVAFDKEKLREFN